MPPAVGSDRSRSFRPLPGRAGAGCRSVAPWEGAPRVTARLCLGSQEPLSPASFSLAGLLPDLRHILVWMANAIELLYFIQQQGPVYMQSLEQELDVTGAAPGRSRG